MKIFKFLFNRKYDKYQKLSFDNILREIKSELRIQNKKYKNDFLLKNNFSDSVLENVLISVINTRCNDTSLTNSFIKNENSLKIKLFGENSYFYKNCKWVELINEGKLNEDLKIKDDLNFSNSHLYFIINSYLQFFEISDKNNNLNNLIITLIDKNEIKTIKDLKNILNKIIIEG